MVLEYRVVFLVLLLTMLAEVVAESTQMELLAQGVRAVAEPVVPVILQDLQVLQQEMSIPGAVEVVAIT